jgi:hypothetical protein
MPKNRPYRGYGMDTNDLATITKMTIEGKSTREIGAVIGVAHNTVAFHQKKPDIRAYIEAEADKLIRSGLSVARKVITRRAAEGLIKTATDIDKDRSLKAAIHITNVSGISGSAPGIVINNIYSQVTHTELSVDAMDLLSRVLSHTNVDVIDVDKPVDK